MTEWRAIEADITTLAVDAIVNAANSSLLGGGGVDGAIHRAAGPELVSECRLLGGCPVGEARITRGYKLPASYVIHTVGPVWRGGTQSEADKLGNCYRTSLELARERDLRSIAFPAISTGIYGYPAAQAASVAAGAVARHLAGHKAAFDLILFCCFSPAATRLYSDAVAAARS